MDLHTWLKEAELFRGVPEDVLFRNIAEKSLTRRYTKEAQLIMPQQKVERLGVILTGTVHIIHFFADGTYNIMNVLEEGELLGADLIATRSGLSPYYAAAASPVCIAYLPAGLLDGGILPEEYRSGVMRRLLALVSDENMKKEYRLAILSRNGLRERILTYLTMQSAKKGTKTFSIHFSREELASFLCVNRSALSHELSLMRRDGLIEFQKNTFTILQGGDKLQDVH